MKEIRTEIEINASPERVWQVLTDFVSYPDWNPFMRQIIGEVKTGSKLEIQLHTSSGKSRSYRPVVTKVEPNRELRWYGRSFLPGLLNGERIFTIEPTETNQVRFIHIEIFTGLGVSLAGDRLDKDIRLSFEEMNKAIKRRAEQGK